MHDEEWLLIEWPKGEKEPTKYWLSTLPAHRMDSVWQERFALDPRLHPPQGAGA